MTDEYRIQELKDCADTIKNHAEEIIGTGLRGDLDVTISMRSDELTAILINKVLFRDNLLEEQSCQ